MTRDKLEAIKDVTTIAMFVAASIYFAETDARELAAAAIATASTLVVPRRGDAKVPPIAVGLVVGIAVATI